MVPCPEEQGGDRASAAALRAVLHVLLSAWRLSLPEAAAALGVDARTLITWRDDPVGAVIDALRRRRLSALLRLHKALRARWPDAASQRAWLRAPGGDGRTPLERLGRDGPAAPVAVRRELEARHPVVSGAGGTDRGAD